MTFKDVARTLGPFNSSAEAAYEQVRRHPVAPDAAVALAGLSGGGGGDEANDEPTGPTDAPFVGGDLHSLVADPGDPERAFVGGHEAVAVSADGGSTWRRVDSLDGADAMGWAFAGDRVLVSGHPGLFVSEDGGRTFEMPTDGLPATDPHAIGASPDGSVIYAGSPPVGVFASTDGGRTWETRSEEAGRSFMGRILVDPADADHVVAPDLQAGAVESTDGGRTWRPLGGVEGAMWVSWDPADVRHLIVSGMEQAAESRDGGQTFEPIDVPSGFSMVEIVPGRPDTLLAASHDGERARTVRSTDGGKTWS
ncbi:MAG: exo-alpha-sialidase [Actinobacteria bacterium]|nr:exo-alpha-sialidase [Actinomycetota bacterium]